MLESSCTSSFSTAGCARALKRCDERAEDGKLIANDVLKLFLDLADLIQIDCSSLSVIVTTYVSFRAWDGETEVPFVRVEMFRVVLLLRIIPSFEDEAHALASFRLRGRGA